MNCQECKEKMLLYLDKSLKEDLSSFNDHISSCPGCKKELEELKLSFMLVKDKEAFCPKESLLVRFASGDLKDTDMEEHLKYCSSCARAYEILKEQEELLPLQPERAEKETPQIIKNAVRSEYPVLPGKEKKASLLPSLKFAYVFALLLCAGIALYVFLWKPDVAVKKDIPAKEALYSYEAAQTAAEKTVHAPEEKKEELLIAAKKASAPKAASKTKKPSVPKTTAEKTALPEAVPAEHIQPATSLSAASKTSADALYSAKEAYEAPAGIMSKKALVLGRSDSKEIAKQVIAEYKNVEFNILEKDSGTEIYLYCPKDMDETKINELKEKLTAVLGLKKDKDKIIVISR
ncbi:MAG: hypothetical protein ABIH00_07560 [Armatimonadota bacterium]